MYTRSVYFFENVETPMGLHSFTMFSWKKVKIEVAVNWDEIRYV